MTMEKGFNDDELADIMNEIESLEEEFSEDINKVSEPMEKDVVEDIATHDNAPSQNESPEITQSCNC